MEWDKKTAQTQNCIDQEAFSKYFEHVKDVLKHFFTIVASILAFSITLIGTSYEIDKMPEISKGALIFGWLCLIVALSIAAIAMDNLFIAYENIFVNYCGLVVDVGSLMKKVSRMCSICIALFIIGTISLGFAVTVRFW
jgi:hypothetical protein